MRVQYPGADAMTSDEARPLRRPLLRTAQFTAAVARREHGAVALADLGEVIDLTAGRGGQRLVETGEPPGQLALRHQGEARLRQRPGLQDRIGELHRQRQGQLGLLLQGNHIGLVAAHDGQS